MWPAIVNTFGSMPEDPYAWAGRLVSLLLLIGRGPRTVSLGTRWSLWSQGWTLLCTNLHPESTADNSEFEREPL